MILTFHVPPASSGQGLPMYVISIEYSLYCIVQSYSEKFYKMESPGLVSPCQDFPFFLSIFLSNSELYSIVYT